MPAEIYSPQKNAMCRGCVKRDHLAKVCRSRLTNFANALVGMQFSKGDRKQSDAYMATRLAGDPTGLDPAVIKVKISRKIVKALINSGALENFIYCKVFEELQLGMHGFWSKFPWLQRTAQMNLLDKFVLRLKFLEIIIN